MSLFARLWSSSHRTPKVKEEENSDEIGLVPQDETISNHIQKQEDNAEQREDEGTQNHDTWGGFRDQGIDGDEPMNLASSKADKAKKRKKKKKEKRKSKDAAEELEVETPQLGDDNSLEENSFLDGVGESVTNGQTEGPFAEERFVVEDTLKSNRTRKANGTAPKRKRAPKSKSAVSLADDAAGVDGHGDETSDEAATNVLMETSQPRKTAQHAKRGKPHQAIVNPDLEPKTLDSGESEPVTRDLSKEDLSELPQRIKKAKKSKARRVSDGPSSRSPEDEDDAAAMLYQPLSPTRVPHATFEPDTQEVSLVASSQLQKDAPSILSPKGSPEPVDGEDTEDDEPKQPSKKALGKRKAVDELVSRRSDKKTKRGKDKESAGRDLRTFGFMSERHGPDQSPTLLRKLGYITAKLYEETHRASPDPAATSSSQASLTTARPSWNAVNNPVEPDSGDESDQSIFVPDEREPESPEPLKSAPKSSVRKRRLPVNEPGPSNSTPANKARSTPAKPRAKTPKTPKAKENLAGAKQYPQGTFTKGKLSTEELEAISSAVESYRIHYNLTQRQVNEVIQSDAQKSVAQEMWKSICDEVPDIPRRNVQNTCRRKFHNFEARGAWNEEQDDELRRAYDEHPGKWKMIGETLNRFPEDVRDRWRNYLVCGDTLKKDAWDIEEEERLRAAVKQCIQEERQKHRLGGGLGTLLDEESLIDWQKVSEHMARTRSRLQCRNKWKKLKDREETNVDDPVAKMPISESWRLEEAALQARLFSAEEKLALLRTIRESGAAREGKIPWQTIKDDLNGKGKRMAWKYCFRQLKNRVPDHDDMDFKDIVAHLVHVFETAAPDEPHGFDLPIEVFPPYINPNKKKPQADCPSRQRRKNDNEEGLSTPTKRTGQGSREDESEDSDDGAEEVSTVKRRRVRDRMLKEGESQESPNSHGEASVDIEEDVVQSFQSMRRTRATNGKRVIWKSKRNQALSEEKVIEDPSDDEVVPVTSHSSKANEDEMDIDQGETYTSTGGPAADDESDDEASDEDQEESEDFDVGASGRNIGYHTEGSPDLDTPVHGRSFKEFVRPPYTNGYLEDDSRSVTSDDDDMSDIPARRQPRKESIEL